MWDSIPAAEHCSEEIQPDRVPEFLELDFGDPPVIRGSATGIVVDHIQAVKSFD